MSQSLLQNWTDYVATAVLSKSHADLNTSMTVWYGVRYSFVAGVRVTYLNHMAQKFHVSCMGLRI